MENFPQTRPRFSQLCRAWKTVSGSLLQLEQVDDRTTFRFTRLSKVGRELVQARTTQKFLSCLELSVSTDQSRIFCFPQCLKPKPALYFPFLEEVGNPSLTEYFPSLVFGQIKMSSWGVIHIGIDFIFCASKGRKYLSINTPFHQPEFSSKRSATTASAGISEIGEQILPEPIACWCIRWVSIFFSFSPTSFSLSRITNHGNWWRELCLHCSMYNTIMYS